MKGKHNHVVHAQCQDHLGHKYIIIGVGCSNQMQLAQGHHLNVDLALVLPRPEFLGWGRDDSWPMEK